MSKIPEGATHIHHGSTAQYKKLRPGSNSLWLTYVDGDWFDTVNATPEKYIPIDFGWDGVGLPPVGSVIDTDHKNKEIRVKILAYGAHYGGESCVLVADMSHGLEGKMFGWMSDQCNFRPVRTPEQIAAEKRDAAIKEMQRLVGSCNTFPFAELYDYGYRLQVEK